MRSDVCRGATLFLLLACLASCGLIVSFDDFDTGPGGAAGKFAIGGTVDGLDGPVTVGLTLNGGEMLPAANGPFTFSNLLADGADYVVAIAENGTPSGHTCSVENGTDRVVAAAVAGVRVHCPSNEASLDSLTVGVGPLQPGFTPSLVDYAAPPIGVPALPSLPVTLVAVDARAHEKGARIVIGTAEPVLGVAHADVPAASGSNAITVVVTAPDGVTRKTYRVGFEGAALPSDYLKASNTRTGAQFGTVVAVSGDTIVVGSPPESSSSRGVGGSQADGGAAGAGAVYVFRVSSGGWVQEAYLKAPNTAVSIAARFGSAVVIDGDTLVVGAPNENSGLAANPLDGSAISAGAVFVFTRANKTWSQQAYVKASDITSVSRFGTSVSLSGDTLVVGADAAPNGSRAGAAYVFTRSGNVWSQQGAPLRAANARNEAGFGNAVAVDGDTLVVGASNESSLGPGVNGDSTTVGPGNGAAYVFVRSGVSWSQQAFIKSAHPGSAGTSFGAALALAKDLLVVGAPNDGRDAGGAPDPSGSSGAIYFFARSGTTWTQQSLRRASNARPSALFGASLAMVGDRLAVGSPGENSSSTGIGGAQTPPTGLPQAGAVYLFARQGGGWSQAAFVKASNTRAKAMFGASVALSSTRLMVGSPGETSNATGVNGGQSDTSLDGAGAAYAW